MKSSSASVLLSQEDFENCQVKDTCKHGRLKTVHIIIGPDDGRSPRYVVYRDKKGNTRACKQ